MKSGWIAFGILCLTALGTTGVRAKEARMKFFRTVQKEGRWWLIDPQEKLFLSMGICHVSFTADHAPALGYSPYERAARARYGTPEAWAKTAVERMKGWGFNTIGAWSSSETFRQGIAYTVILDLAGSVTKDAWLKGSFPDVFSKAFREGVEEAARKRCAAHRDDPMLLGYFTDNELRWGPDWRSSKPLLDEFLSLPAEAEGKQSAVSFLKSRYPDIADLNDAWGTALSSWEQLASSTDISPGPAAQAAAVEKDRSALLKEVAAAYFRTTSEAIRKADPNHLILGVRFAGYAPDPVLEGCAPYLDVISFNNYDTVPPKDTLDRIYRITKKPVMITEFSFKAMDSGLPNTRGAGAPVAAQQDRADGYERYVTAALELPYCVGLHWFEHADEPKEGRFDGENSNYGVVNIADKTYEVLTGRMKTVHEKAFEIARRGKLVQ